MAKICNWFTMLGYSAAYIRQAGLDPLQQEQMVLRYTRQHKQVTRKEVAELCCIGPYQTTRLLDRLAMHGKL